MTETRMHDVRAYEGARNMAQEAQEGDRPVGLRERKRRATRSAIERAAITLVDECGYEGVTVAQICDRANVSQGTFFNYFPTMAASFVGK